MEIEIESRKDNKLLKRDEVHFTINYEGKTPSRRKVRKQLKDILGKNIIIVEHIKPIYGAQQARGYARAYSSEKQARLLEPNHIIERNLTEGSEPAEKESKEKPTKEQPTDDKEQPADTKEQPTDDKEQKSEKTEEA
jgi:small subunit ribosomal protein S24e